MRLFNRFKKRSASNVAYFFDTSGNNSHILAGYQSLDKNPDVQICVNTIADLVSSMSIQQLENVEGGDIRIYDEFSKKIDVSPNKHMTRKTFIQSIIREALLKGDGNCIVIPNFNRVDGNYYLNNLEILDMNRVTFYKYEDTYKIKYLGHDLNPDEVLHFVFVPSRDCPYYGEGYAPILKDIVTNVAQGNATKNSFFKSKFAPSVIISVDADSEELMDNESREKILQSYIGNTEAGKPWLIPSNEITVHQVTPLSLRDLAINESLEIERKQIAAAFGIPPFMVGLGEFKREEYNQFISTKIKSFADVIQQELTKKLIFSNKRHFKFNARSLMQYEIKELSSLAKDLTGLGIINRNESRKLFDFEPINTPGMNDFSTLENYIKVDDLSKQKKLVQDKALEGGETNE